MNKLDVINMALDYLEEEPIDSSSNKRTAMGKKADRWYPRAAYWVLDYGDWLEAIDHSTLTTEASITNMWDDYFQYVYDLPSDCLRALDLDLNENAPYIVEGDYLYTNYYNASTGVNLRYIKDIREETNSSLLYSDILAEAVACRLAYNMAPLVKKQVLRDALDDILVDAINSNQLRDRSRRGHERQYWDEVDRYRGHAIPTYDYRNEW